MSYIHTSYRTSQPSDSEQPPVPRSFPPQEHFQQDYIPYPNLSVPPPPPPPSPSVYPHPANISYSQPPFVVSGPQWHPYPVPGRPQQYRSIENISLAGQQHGISQWDRNASVESDEQWVQRYLTTIGKDKKTDTRLKTEYAKLRIRDAHDSVNVCVSIVQDLKTLEKELNGNIDVFTPEEWEEKCTIIASKKVVLSQNLNALTAPKVAESLCLALTKRLKKRQRQQRQREHLKKVKADARVRRKKLHKKLDEWLGEVQLTVDKAKAEESLKRQADLVLADVTRKQVEARRQVTLLSMLVKLRQLRVQAATSRGERVSAEQVEIFENVVHKLTTFWSDQLKTYNVEETGLRVMLEEETQEKKKNVTSKQQSVFSEWQRVLFGRNARDENPYLAAENDVHSFISVRQDWDKFIAHDGAPMASSIPIGWIVPVTPSSDDWAKLITTYQA